MTATQMLAHKSVNLFQFNNPLKHKLLYERVVSGKTFKAIASLVYIAGKVV